MPDVTPTHEDLARDVRDDLALCEAATRGPWRATRFKTIWIVEYGPADDPRECFDLLEDLPPTDAAFIAAAREGWPAALRRAIAAEADNQRLRDAISTHRNQRADDRCWMDDLALYAATGVPAPEGLNCVGDPEAMLANCKRFVAQRCQPGGGWPSYAELEAKVAALQRYKDWTHAYLDAHGVPHHPPGPHGAEGCRIGDRMDWLMAQLDAAQAEVARLQGILDALNTRIERLEGRAER